MDWYEQKGKAFLVPFIGIICVVLEGVGVEEEESGITSQNVCVCVMSCGKDLGKQQRKQVQ